MNSQNNSILFSYPSSIFNLMIFIIDILNIDEFILVLEQYLNKKESIKSY